MVILWHATPRSNLASIAERGLLTALARGRLAVVWLHTRSQTQRIRDLVALRHQVKLDQVELVGVRLARPQVRRFRRGLWYTRLDIRPQWLILPFDLDAQAQLYAECPW